ncbi:hypothetical protein [Thalassoglobus sp.]|uniref:hypothetical protein n=1 Tax=Thalassoglobus sp. TaxID=2795869 RepID=UPI003AA8F6BB
MTWYFDLPVNGEEGGIQRLWRLEAAWNWQTAHVLILAACLLWIGVWLVNVMARHQSRLVRIFLFSNRLLIIFLVALLILQVRLKTVAYGQPKLTLLVDTSGSMSLTDRYSAEDLKRLQGIGVSRPNRPRIEILKDFLTTGSSSWLDRAISRYELELLTFDSRLHLQQEAESLSVSQRELLFKSVPERLSKFRATGATTDFVQTLDELGRIQRDRPSAAIVLLSDGNPTAHSASALVKTEKTFSRLRIPVYAVGVGSRRSTGDLAITRTDLEPVGFAGEDHPLTVSLEANQDVKVPVTIRIRNILQDSEVFSVTIDGLRQGVTESVPMVLPDLAAGRNDFEIEVVPLAGETDLKDNLQRIRVWGRESDLNVLLVDRSPRWEYRHLKATLERDSHLAVQTFLFESDPAFAVEDRTALNRLPKSLETIDAVILGDVDFKLLDGGFVAELQRFVREQGGGLLLLSAETSLGSLDLSSGLAEMHPAVEQSGEESERMPTQIVVTAEGKAQGVLPVGTDPDQLGQLPLIYPDFKMYAAKPAAIPLLQGVNSAQAGQMLPLILSMRYGKGVIIQHLFDDSWRWRPVANGEFYRKVWSQMIRNLCRRKLLDQLPPLELLTDQDEYRPYESIQVRLLDRKAKYQNLDSVIVELKADSGSTQNVTLRRTQLPFDGFASTIENLNPGEYAVSFDSREESVATIRTRFRVLDSDPEEEYIPMNESLLRSLSESTHGAFLHPWEIDSILDQLPERKLTGYSETRLIPLWNRSEILIVFIIAMSIEWIFRRRAGLD